MVRVKINHLIQDLEPLLNIHDNFDCITLIKLSYTQMKFKGPVPDHHFRMMPPEEPVKKVTKYTFRFEGLQNNDHA